MTKKKTSKKAQIGLGLNEDVAALLRQRAAEQGLSVYVYAGDLLTTALLNTHKEDADQLLAPHIRKVVREELKHMSDQVIEMLVRIYMEGGTSRRLTQAVLSYVGNLNVGHMDSETLSKATQTAWNRTYSDMDESLAGLIGWRGKVSRNQLLRIQDDEADKNGEGS